MYLFTISTLIKNLKKLAKRAVEGGILLGLWQQLHKIAKDNYKSISIQISFWIIQKISKKI
jgi:hypothetical protein